MLEDELPEVHAGMSKRNCIDCIHWHWDSGYGRLSDMTPGTNWSSHCAQGHWEMEGHNVSEQRFRDNMRTARRCTDYTERLAVLPSVADFGFSREILVRRGNAWSTMAIADCTEESMQGVDEWRRIGP